MVIWNFWKCWVFLAKVKSGKVNQLLNKIRTWGLVIRILHQKLVWVEKFSSDLKIRPWPWKGDLEGHLMKIPRIMRNLRKSYGYSKFEWCEWMYTSSWEMLVIFAEWLCYNKIVNMLGSSDFWPKITEHCSAKSYVIHAYDK